MSTALSTIRIVLIILSIAASGCSIYFLTRQQVGIRAETWFVWTPLIIAILSNILFTCCTLSSQTRISTARSSFAFILAVGWLVSPSYRIHRIAQLTSGTTSASTSFFTLWNCGTLTCTLSMVMDIAGLLAGVLALVELSLAERLSRGVIAPASNKTSIFIIPGGEQQYIPLQQQQQTQQQFQAPYYQPAQSYYPQTQPPTATAGYPAQY